VNNKLFKDFKAGKQAQNGLVLPGVTQEVIPENCQIKRGVVNEDGQPFYKLLQLCLGEYLQLQFMFMDEGWTDKRFDFKMYFICEFSVY
jgi:hypothetical protein